MTAEVESFTTYYAICEECHWEGPEREDDKASAERDQLAHDAEKHEQTREEFQAALDEALERISA